MLRHKNIDRICCVFLALTLLASFLFVSTAATGIIAKDTTIGYETRLFDQSRVHTIDIVMNDWDAFLDTATREEYASCHLVIDGESYRNVAIRGKGNTSLSSVAGYGNDRYSFKVEFDHYQSGGTYHGLDKLSLNNLIYDNTYVKDYFAYAFMNRMGVAAPLCSFVQLSVNGEAWGLYLAVEGVEDAFLRRNYGRNHGELYKPDSMSFGGGRGNGADFDIDALMERFGASADGTQESFIIPDMSSFTVPGNFQMPEGFDPSQWMGSFGGSSGQSAASPEVTATAAPTAAPTDNGSFGGSSGMPAGGEAPAQNGGSFGGSSGQSAASPEVTATAAPTAAPTDNGSFGGSSGMPAGNDFVQGLGSSGSSGASADTTAPPVETYAMPEGRPANEVTPGQMARGSGERGGFGGGFNMGSSDVKLQYIDDVPASYTNIFNNAKTDVSGSDQARLISSLKALSEGDASVIDAEAVLRYMAVHNFLCNDDSYTGTIVHNYYLYEENGVLSMIPWDYNLAYGGHSMGFGGGSDAASIVNRSIDALVSNGGSGDRPMADWITASSEALGRYHAIYAEFMTTVFESGWFEAEMDRVMDMISPWVASDPTAFCTYEEFLKGADTLKAFCLKRAQSVRHQLDGSNTRVDATELDLSVMGSMDRGMGNQGISFKRYDKNNGGHGGTGGKDSFPAASAGKENGDVPPTPGMNAEGGTPDMPRDAAEPSAMQTAPVVTEGPSAAATGAGESHRIRPGQDAVDTTRLGGQFDRWICLAVCAVLLSAALIFAKCYRANR